MSTLISSVDRKIREDFSFLEQPANWKVVSLGGGMAIDWSVASGMRVTTGTTPGQETVLRYSEPLEPAVRVMFLALGASMISQRIANQEFEFRLVNPEGDVAAWLLDGTNATTGKMRTKNGGVGPADTTLSGLPDSNTGSLALEIETFIDEVYFHARPADSVNGRSSSGVRNRQIPDPTRTLFIEIAIRNLATAPASSTTFQLDSMTVQDINEITAEVTAGRGGGPVSQSIPVSGTLGVSSLSPGTSATQLGKAEDAVHTTGDVGVAVWGVRAQAVPAAITTAAGDYSPILTDAEGKVIVANTADPANTVQAVLDATLASSVAIVAAGAAGIRMYVTDLTFENTGATANRVVVYDGATRIYSVTVPPSSTVEKSFLTPLKGTAATALNVALGAAGTVTVSVSGYRGI